MVNRFSVQGSSVECRVTSVEKPATLYQGPQREISSRCLKSGKRYKIGITGERVVVATVGERVSTPIW